MTKKNKPDRPIINSLLDTDFYTFTVGQWTWKYFPDIKISYSLINRTKNVALSKIIDERELREQLDHARTLTFSNHDLHDIGGTFEYGNRMFKEEYVNFLQTFKLPEYNLESGNEQYRLEFSGHWSTAIYWETIGLPIINELYTRHFLDKMTRFEKDVVFAKARLRLNEKIEILRRHPGLIFSDFGTRRRFSHHMQDYIVETLAEEMKGQFLGSSNMYFAMKYGIMPMGTKSHQIDMIMAAIMGDTEENMRQSVFEAMRLWWEMYGYGLSVFLPDTFGSRFFFKNAPAEIARDWKGGRQDSGDPWIWSKWLLEFYKKHDVDPKTKLFLASDGLNVERMVQLYDFFHRQFKIITFGIGTNLTFDVPFFPARPISLVIKPTKACGKDLFKLSDNIKKATGTPETIENGKRIFGYEEKFQEECVY